MKEIVKKKWIEALRSGKYKQGESTLCRINANGEKVFCCLGVLMDIANIAPWVPSRHSNFILTKKGQETQLDENYLKMLGLTEDEHCTLISLNDGLADTPKNDFSEIADYIEKNIRVI